MIQLLAATVLVTIMPKHCAEFRDEPQSVTMQRNLRHIFLGGHDALPSPHPTFWGRVSMSPQDLRHWSVASFQQNLGVGGRPDRQPFLSTLEPSKPVDPLVIFKNVVYRVPATGT